MTATRATTTEQNNTEEGREMFQVFHKKETHFEADRGPFVPMDFEMVAEVEAADLEQVFEKTNHIDRPWQKNEGVFALTDCARSTSVGDVVVDPEAAKAWVVDFCGFAEIPMDPGVAMEVVS
jgi:hypothetical protein